MSSFLRMLATSKPTTYQREEPELSLHIPAYGALYLTPSVQPFGPQEPGYVNEPHSLKGWIQVRIPTELGRCRCKSIKVGFRTVCRLAMGPHRGWETDVIFERAEMLKDVWLEEGSTRYEFAFTLPENIPAMDWHENAKLRHELYAVVEGVPAPVEGLFQSLRSSSPIRSGGLSPRSSPSSSRAASPPAGVTPKSQDLNPAPPYGGGDRWLEGSLNAKRSIRVIWNPNQTVGVNSLDEKMSYEVLRLGQCEVHFKAPLWTVCSLLHTRIQFPTLPPSVTLFHIRVDIVQTVVLRSPRDQSEDKAVHTTRRIMISKQGKLPAKDTKRPDGTQEALWRGEQCGGADSGEFEVIMKGRLPNDVDNRPSTLHVVTTPVHVSHKLLVEVVYSMWSHDQQGRPMARPGPGELQMISIDRPVILPGCPNIPDNIGLPEYAPDPSGRLSLPDEPCPLCKVSSEDRQCLKCPFDRPIHSRHDHPPKLVGSADGTCPLCSVFGAHEGDKQWQCCTCALGFEELERLGEKIQKAGGATAVELFPRHSEGAKVEYDPGVHAS